MTTVDENRLRGNYAQALVMSWLSRSCLVRPVAEGTDIGVDLYCESVVEKTLYLHFWVQVKAVPADSVKFRHGKAKATYPFETKHLNYWGRQPVPVYALLVPLGDWPPEVPDFICGVRVTNEIVRRGVPEDQVTKSYSTSDGFASENIDSELQHFFTKVVPVDTAALLQPRGIIAPLPDVPGDPDRQFVADVGIQHLPKALETMVGTAEASLMECVIAEGKERFVVHRQPEPSEDGTDAIPGCVATSGLRRQDGPPLASTVPGPPSCPATIRSNGASSNPPSSSSAFGGTCGMP